MEIQTFTKDAHSVLDYEWDWSEWLADVSDTIASASFIADDSISVDSFSYTSTAALAWISGGAAGSNRVICRIVTDGGRTDDRSIIFKVAEL